MSGHSIHATCDQSVTDVGNPLVLGCCWAAAGPHFSAEARWERARANTAVRCAASTDMGHACRGGEGGASGASRCWGKRHAQDGGDGTYRAPGRGFKLAAGWAWQKGGGDPMQAAQLDPPQCVQTRRHQLDMGSHADNHANPKDLGTRRRTEVAHPINGPRQQSKALLEGAAAAALLGLGLGLSLGLGLTAARDQLEVRVVRAGDAKAGACRLLDVVGACGQFAGCQVPN